MLSRISYFHEYEKRWERNNYNIISFDKFTNKSRFPKSLGLQENFPMGFKDKRIKYLKTSDFCTRTEPKKLMNQDYFLCLPSYQKEHLCCLSARKILHAFCLANHIVMCFLILFPLVNWTCAFSQPRSVIQVKMIWLLHGQF